MCCPILSFPDDCTDALTEAKELYKSGNFPKAKELFEYVKSECPQNYSEAANWINKCTEAQKNKHSSIKQAPSQEMVKVFFCQQQVHVESVRRNNTAIIGQVTDLIFLHNIL